MKIGILGYSSIARRCIIPAIKQIEDLELAGVGSRNVDTGKMVCKYSYDELLNSDVDIIYVSLPVALHYEWGKKVLLSGKHLLMEKTFTTTENEAAELFEIADRKSLRCMEALMYEFHPVQDKIDYLVKDLGDIKHIEASFGFPYFTNKNDIRYSKELGGGSILDSLIYPLSFIHRILGKEILDYNTFLIESDVVERGTISLRYKNAVANINFGFGQAYINEVRISGSEKMLKASRVFSRTDECINPIEIIQNNKSLPFAIEKSNHFENMIRYFIDKSSSLEAKKENTILRMRFMDKIRKYNEK